MPPSPDPVRVGETAIDESRELRVPRRRSSVAAATRISEPGPSSARATSTVMLAAAEADARAHGCDRLHLEVRADNGAGIRLYERRGYARLGVRADYYEDGMEAWRYGKAL